MTMWQRPSAMSLLTAHLRGELERGRWQGKMPGVIRLARELGAARKTVEAALCEMEKEGLLVAQGHGRGRVIATTDAQVKRPLRIAILVLEPAAVALTEGYIVDLLRRLGEAGHHVFFTNECLEGLRMEVKRVAKVVHRTEADAWVVGAGSLEVLEWFAAQPLPAFALFGRRHGLPIAGVGPDMIAACATATRRLIELGHRRIILLGRRLRRLPQPGACERVFLQELAAHGIQTGSFNLPDWEETTDGFHACLKELFRVTSPTAIMVEEVPHLYATLQFLAVRGLQVPGDVSLVCCDYHPTFEWSQPMISHIRWDSLKVVPHILRWANNVALNKDDLRQKITPAEFVEGGTIGPVPRR